MTRLVIDLQDDLAGRLARIAREEGATEAQVVGKAVEEYVRHHEQGQVFQEMREYAEELAAHSDRRENGRSGARAPQLSVRLMREA